MKKELAVLFFVCGISSFAKAEPQAYDFSDKLKKAVLNCTIYSEDILEKNPDLRGWADKMFLNVKGMSEDNCIVAIKYDFQLPISQEYICLLPQEYQGKLVNAMNDKSTEIKTRTFNTKDFSSTLTDREFNLTLSEIMMKFCKVSEEEPSEEELAEMEYKEKEMMKFSAAFKGSLKKCSPDKDTLKIMEQEIGNIEIKGKENNKCHVVLQGFHILLNDDELSLSGFDEISELLSDEKRAVYRPSYAYTGLRSSLKDCLNEDEAVVTTYVAKKISLGNVQVQQKLESYYENNICRILIGLELKRNEKIENYSLQCDIPKAKIENYINPEKSITVDEANADQEIFSQITKAGMCKKISELPAVNSEGCSDSSPLKGNFDECYSCDRPEGISLGKSRDCERVCNGLHGRSKRIIEHFDCVLQTCPTEKPLRDRWGNCYSCNYRDSVDAMESCSVCKNRKIKDKKCVITD